MNLRGIRRAGLVRFQDRRRLLDEFVEVRRQQSAPRVADEDDAAPAVAAEDLAAPRRPKAAELDQPALGARMRLPEVEIVGGSSELPEPHLPRGARHLGHPTQSILFEWS
mgnify:CR=1 FL=1